MEKEVTDEVAPITLNVRPLSDSATLLVEPDFSEVKDLFNQICSLDFWAECHVVPRDEINGTSLFLQRRSDDSTPWMRIASVIVLVISRHQNWHKTIKDQLKFRLKLDEEVQINRNARPTAVIRQ